MRTPRALLTALGGVALLVASQLVPGGAAPATSADGLAAAAPLAAALVPLGPARALVSASLWVRFLRSRVDGDDQQLLLLSEGLLAVHPELERVREHLASQLIVTSAVSAPDEARHRALVQRGLAMLEDGLELHDSPGLHGALGRLPAVQPRSDPLFDAAARQYFGEDPTDLAIDELRQAGDEQTSPVFLADLLVDRGLDRWLRDHDVQAADRDLGEAERLTRHLEGGGATDVSERIADIRRQMHEGEAPTDADAPPAPPRDGPTPPDDGPTPEDGAAGGP